MLKPTASVLDWLQNGYDSIPFPDLYLSQCHSVAPPIKKQSPFPPGLESTGPVPCLGTESDGSDGVLVLSLGL